MKLFTKSQIHEIEKKTPFSVEDEGTHYSFRYGTPAGEDFSFDIEKNERETMVEEIKNYADVFDQEDHAKMLMGQSGAPCLRELLCDADVIKEELNKLSQIVKGF